MTKRKRQSIRSQQAPEAADLKENSFISAPEAERLGLHADWPTWPLGADVIGTWEWLHVQVEVGAFPDLPCRWSEHVSSERAVIYWLNPQARTRHIVVGYGHLVLTRPADVAMPAHRMH